MIQLKKTIIIQTFELNQFWLVDHKFAREILTKEFLQIIQIIIITKIKSQIWLFSIKIKFRVTRATFVELFEYSSKWVVDKTAFREACSVFKVSTKEYRTFTEFFVFKSRIDSIESRLNDEFDQLSSSSQSFFLLDAFLKILSTLKKRFHRRSISLQSISLNYALILENQCVVKYLQSIQQSQRIITLFVDSSVSALSAANFARTKRKVRETREERANEKTSRMNRIIKTNLQKMLNVTMIADIAIVVATISQTASQVIAAATASITNTRLERWNSSDIDFFDSNFERKFAFTSEAVTHVEKNIYYRDVHVFVERVKKMIIVLESETIRKNLSSCLRESTLIWHIAKLFDVSRRILFYEENVDEWFQTLIARFKIQVTIATINLLKERYTLTNANRNRESRKYVQKIIRWVKSAKMISLFNQLNIIYNEIDAEFKRDLKKFFKNTTIDDYLQLLNDCKNIWWFLTKLNQEYFAYFTNFSQTSKQFLFNSSFRFYDNRSEFFNQQRYNNWNSQRNQRNQSFN